MIAIVTLVAHRRAGIITRVVILVVDIVVSSLSPSIVPSQSLSLMPSSVAPLPSTSLPLPVASSPSLSSKLLSFTIVIVDVVIRRTFAIIVDVLGTVTIVVDAVACRPVAIIIDTSKTPAHRQRQRCQAKTPAHWQQ